MQTQAGNSQRRTQPTAAATALCNAQPASAHLIPTHTHHESNGGDVCHVVIELQRQLH